MYINSKTLILSSIEPNYVALGNILLDSTSSSKEEKQWITENNIKGPKSYKHRPTNPSVSDLQKQRNKNEYMEYWFKKFGDK